MKTFEEQRTLPEIGRKHLLFWWDSACKEPFLV
jgi:hypothetical protein